jgi:hypothetical protein
VLLQHIGGLEQFFKSLLVENWLFALVGHDSLLITLGLPGS